MTTEPEKARAGRWHPRNGTEPRHRAGTAVLPPPWPAVLVLAAAFVVLTAAVLTGATARPDHAVLNWLTRFDAGAGHALARTLVNGGQLWLAGTLVLAMASIRGLRARSWRPLLVTALAVSGLSLTLAVVNDLVGRTSPHGGLNAVLDAGGSYPSGHAATAVLCLLLLVTLARPAQPITTAAGNRRWVAGAGAGAVGITTILGYHWPTDVIGGWLLGTVFFLPAQATLRLLPPLVADESDRPVRPRLSPEVVGRRHRTRRATTPHRASRGGHRFAALALALAVAVALAGCGSDPNSIAGQARAGDRKGYVSGDGSVEQIPVARRGDPVVLAGTTLDGNGWSLASVPTNKLVVLNVWGSWCGPCVAEAPELEKAWGQLQAKAVPVQFIGLDFKEGPEAGLAFQRRYGVTYPSLAFDGGRPVQALQGKAPTVPTTLVLDRSRRIAGRILGQTDAATLSGLVADILAQEPGAATAPGAGQ